MSGVDTGNGYSLTVCACDGGPYLGARKAGTPCRCGTCGFITQDQLDAILAAAWDRGYTAGHSNAMRRMSDEPAAPTSPNPHRAITP